jgi:hypothetical protein
VNIALDGKNLFHTGWLTRFVGLPKTIPGAAALRDSDLAAFEEGWDTCNETGVPAGPNAHAAFYAMKDSGDVVSYWQDDDGNEIPA